MPDSIDEAMRLEFNRWAAAGRGHGMEQSHASIGEQAIAAMHLEPGQRVLDLGCGNGWAVRRMAPLVAGPDPADPHSFGQVVGLDVSDEMIGEARELARDVDNALFILGSAHEIPWQENYFQKVLSVEAFYYYHDQPRALAEIMRVMGPRAGLYILINLYRENPISLRWVELLSVPVTVRSAEEYAELLRQSGFEDVAWRQVPDLSPTPESYSGRWFQSVEELRECKRIGALLLTGRKPEVESPLRAIEEY